MREVGPPLYMYGALKGQTPVQASMIEVDGKNKWKTIIQNASLNKDSV